MPAPPTENAEAVATWFYPGDNYGEEFVYPKVNATGATANANATPETPSVTAPAETTPAAVAQQTNTPTTRAKPAVAPATKNEPVQIAQAATQPKPQTSAAATTAPPLKETTKRLPKTASLLPVLIVLGLLSLGASAGFHVFSKQSV